jgi:hypothetical protein
MAIPVTPEAPVVIPAPATFDGVATGVIVPVLAEAL